MMQSGFGIFPLLVGSCCEELLVSQGKIGIG
jgi:hypothetical protein